MKQINSLFAAAGAALVVAGCATLDRPEPLDALTADERAEGWELLFDGVNLPKDHWVAKDGCREFPDHGWFVRDGALAMYPRCRLLPDGKRAQLPPEEEKLGGGGDIVTRKSYRDFIFRFEFRLTKAGNSGVKYFFWPGHHKDTCMEYQVLDPGHPDYDRPNPAGVKGTHRIAALYDLQPAPAADAAVRPCGEWNRGEIVARGRKVEHWLNGVKVLEYERGSAEFRAQVAVSKYAPLADRDTPWGEQPEGRLLLQDHGDSMVFFRNLRVKELPIK